MQSRSLIQGILALSGFIGIVVGVASLADPVDFHRTSGIDLHHQVALLNEMRATGGSLLALGTLIAAGAFIASLRRTSALVSTILYLSYGFSRGVAMLVDGQPSGMLIAVMLGELVIGALAFSVTIQLPHAATRASA